MADLAGIEEQGCWVLQTRYSHDCLLQPARWSKPAASGHSRPNQQQGCKRRTKIRGVEGRGVFWSRVLFCLFCSSGSRISLPRYHIARHRRRIPCVSLVRTVQYKRYSMLDDKRRCQNVDRIFHNDPSGRRCDSLIRKTLHHLNGFLHSHRKQNLRLEPMSQCDIHH